MRPLTILTLVAGFASTIFAPLTAALCNAKGWRGAFLVLAGLLAATTVPLHVRCLNRSWQHVSRGAQLIEDLVLVLGIRRSPGFVGLQALMVLPCLGLYTVTRLRAERYPQCCHADLVGAGGLGYP